jgi:hypothetical protein
MDPNRRLKAASQYTSDAKQHLDFYDDWRAGWCWRGLQAYRKQRSSGAVGHEHDSKHWRDRRQRDDARR